MHRNFEVATKRHKKHKKKSISVLWILCIFVANHNFCVTTQVQLKKINHRWTLINTDVKIIFPSRRIPLKDGQACLWHEKQWGYPPFP